MKENVSRVKKKYFGNETVIHFKVFCLKFDGIFYFEDVCWIIWWIILPGENQEKHCHRLEQVRVFSLGTVWEGIWYLHMCLFTINLLHCHPISESSKRTSEKKVGEEVSALKISSTPQTKALEKYTRQMKKKETWQQS